jgi:hypothetical protein
MNWKCCEGSRGGLILEASTGRDCGKPQNISVRIDGLLAEI